MTDTTAFPISYVNDGIVRHAQIQPCCREDNIVDYAVYVDSKLLFTIAHDTDSAGRWIIAMKNADDDIPDDIVQAIGAALTKSKLRNNGTGKRRCPFGIRRNTPAGTKW